MDEIVVGIDVGTTKICTLAGRIEADNIRIMGVGIEPSEGIRKGAVVDVSAASLAIVHSMETAERTSGYRIKTAYVNLASPQVIVQKSHSAVGITTGIVTQDDTERLIEAVQGVDIPTGGELLNVVPLGYRVDGQQNISHPLGMTGDKLEMDVSLISIPSNSANTLRNSIHSTGVKVAQFVLNPVASAKAVLTAAEQDMGVAICDIGGGTTDIAIFTRDGLVHAATLPVNGSHITSDIAYAIQITLADAEQIKLRFGHAMKNGVDPEEMCEFSPSGKGKFMRFKREQLAEVIQARVEEIFNFVLEEIKKSGCLGRLPAGMVLTGGSSLLPGIRNLAHEVSGMPVRLSRPEKLAGLVDKIQSPAFSTSVGLLRWAAEMEEASGLKKTTKKPRTERRPPVKDIPFFGNLFRKLAGNSTTDAPPPGPKKTKG